MATMNDWKPETLALINRLLAAGFTLSEADNGAEDAVVNPTVEQAVQYLTATDESRLYVKNPSGKELGLFLVYGNSPGELVCDYHVDALLDTVVDAHYEEWSNKEQPTIEDPPVKPQRSEEEERRLLGAVADIAYNAGCARYYSGDSRRDISDFIEWAEEFEKLRTVDGQGNETYNGKDYMTAVEEFTLQKIGKA